MKVKIRLLLLLFALIFISCKTTTHTLMVGPSQIPCSDTLRKDCFQVKIDSAEAWENFYGTITGFDYAPGYEYLLQVKGRERDFDPQQVSTTAYELVKVLVKKKVALPAPILQGNFEITTFEDQDVTPVNMSINFDDKTGQVFGKGVCNRFSGTFATSKKQIKFSQAATTRMLCHKPELERDFFQKLNQVNSYLLEDGQLTLSQDKKTVLTAINKKEE